MDELCTRTRINSLFRLSNFLTSEKREDLIREIFSGLMNTKKTISSRFFYDERGSYLFEDITALPEYYPTRTEIDILKANATEILGEFDQLDIIELGSGDSSKISILLDAIPKGKMNKISYIPIDISEAAIYKSADILSLKYPNMTIHGLLADFLKHLNQLPSENKRLICFFGSTLGNLSHSQVNEFIIDLKRHIRKGDVFLLGLDMVKDIRILHNAYNDNQCITEIFNKNILNVVNDIAGTDFETQDFAHHAFYNEKETRMEMHLIALYDRTISSDDFPEPITIKKGQSIHTENSRKFIVPDIHEIALVSGLRIEHIFTDKQQWFSLVMFRNDG